MAELEQELEEYFRRRVRLVGGYTVKLAPTERGVPDRLVIMPGGRMYLVELKTDTGRLSPVQRHWHTKIRAIGGRVYTVHGRADVVRWIRGAMTSFAPTVDD